MPKTSDFLAPPLTANEELGGIIAESIYGRDGANNAISCDEDQFHACMMAADAVRAHLTKTA